jgi:hypothetical protein
MNWRKEIVYDALNAAKEQAKWDKKNREELKSKMVVSAELACEELSRKDDRSSLEEIKAAVDSVFDWYLNIMPKK